MLPFARPPKLLGKTGYATDELRTSTKNLLRLRHARLESNDVCEGMRPVQLLLPFTKRLHETARDFASARQIDGIEGDCRNALMAAAAELFGE